MIRHSKNLALAAALVLFALPSLTHAQGTDGKKDEPDLKMLMLKLDGLEKSLQKGFKDIAKDMGNVEAAVLKAEQRIDALEKQVYNKKPEPIGSGNGEVRDRLIRIEEKLAKIEADIAMVYGKIPVAKVTTERRATSGRVLLANFYGEDLTFYVNDKRWDVPAQSTVVIDDVPVGPFTYRMVWHDMVIGSRAATLNPGQTFTVSAK